MTAKQKALGKEKILLDADVRTVSGKKVKKLRREGLLPANIYGEDVKSHAIQIPVKDFRHVYKLAGETQIVYVRYDGTETPTIIHNLQLHPLSGALLHTDFRKVNLKKKIETEVPVKFVGESEAVNLKKADMLILKNELLVEALPDNIPVNIEIDIGGLVNYEDEIAIKNLPKVEFYSFVDEPETIIVKVIEHKEEVIETTPSDTVSAEGEEPTLEDDKTGELSKENVDKTTKGDSSS